MLISFQNFPYFNVEFYGLVGFLLPDAMKVQVADFIEFLEQKAKKGMQEDNKPLPKFGSAKGMFVMHDDFDEPLED